MTKKLSLKQKNFVHEYLRNGGNATKAASQAYDTDNYASARVIGSHNLTKVNIASYIDEILADSDGLTLNDTLDSLAECLHTPLKPTPLPSQKSLL